MMRLCPLMGWTPHQFWSATPREWRLAFEGFAQSRGIKVATFAERITATDRLARLKQLNDNPEPERKANQ